jgi:hypothetical protein
LKVWVVRKFEENMERGVVEEMSSDDNQRLKSPAVVPSVLFPERKQSPPR